MSMQERYLAAMHRVQTAIAFNFGLEYPWMDQRLQAALKHLRVGIDGSKSDQAGLARLLIKKGVFTEEEYVAAVTESAEREAELQQEDLQKAMRTGNPDLNIRTV